INRSSRFRSLTAQLRRWPHRWARAITNVSTLLPFSHATRLFASTCNHEAPLLPCMWLAGLKCWLVNAWPSCYNTCDARMIRKDYPYIMYTSLPTTSEDFEQLDWPQIELWYNELNSAILSLEALGPWLLQIGRATC